MRRVLILAKRNVKESLVDPVSLIFCLGLPLCLLILMELLFGKITEVTIFNIENFAPAIVNFGFTFLGLYIALTVSGDKESAFMSRIKVSPLSNLEYLLSFIVGSLPMAIISILLFYITSLFFGLKLSVNLLLSLPVLLCCILFYCSLGILVGSAVKTQKQAGPVCSIIITAAGLLGGIWMPVETVGEGFLNVVKCLPFYNGVKATQNAVNGNYSGIIIPTLITLIYAVAVFFIAVILFKKTVTSKK